MAEYIEREAVMKTVKDGNHSDFGISMADLTSLREVLEDTPTADVAEVKHSEWHCSSVSMKTRNITCRHCRRTETISNGRENFDYCPNCGARMDGEGE